MIPEKQASGNVEPLRICPDCRKEKTSDEFYRRRKNAFSAYCKACTYIRERRWVRENPEKTALRLRRSWLKRYNLTLDEYDDLLAAQGGVCAICKTDKPGGMGRFHIDHDHACCPEEQRSCGKCIRGLLCSYCNRYLARGDPERLRNAADYIENFRRIV